MGNIKEYKLKLKEKQMKVYNENKLLVMIVYLVGNKVALQKQIEEILLYYKIYTDAQSIYRAVDRLYDAELVDKKKYEDMNLIVLRNPVIKWIAEEMNEKQGKALFNAQSVGDKLKDETVYVSLFRMEYFINHVKSSKSSNDLELDLYNLLKNNSILYRKDKGYEMLVSFVVKNVQDRQKKEFHTHAEKLKKHKENKSKSIPDRNGKGKEYVDNKRKSFQDGTYNILSKKKKRDEYDFNSILNTKNLVLELDRYETSRNTTDYAVAINDNKLYFKLYIMDINNSMNYRALGDMSRKTYLMLKDIFGKETIFVSKNPRCIKCPFYVHNTKMFEALKEKRPEVKACYPGTEHQRINCNEWHEMLVRDIYLDVAYIGWNQDRVNSMKLECNKIGYDEEGQRDYPNFKHRVITGYKDIISSYDFDEYFNLSFVNYDLDKFSEHKGSENLEEYNKAKRQNAFVKEEFKQNDELVQLLKAISNKIKDSNMSIEEFIDSL